MITRAISKINKWWLVPVALFILICSLTLIVVPNIQRGNFTFAGDLPTQVIRQKTSHIPTPESLRGIYMTSWVAGTPSLRANIIKLIDETEINAVVIDIKDYTGNISFAVNDPELQKIGSAENRIRDLDALIKDLHDRNIYVIGRISAFQDAYMSKLRPDLSVQRETGTNADGTTIWRDRKGISWIDASSKEMWDYLVRIGREAYARGFDELNFDYIRFPSDGDMKNISYPFTGATSKPEALKEFFAYIDEQFADTDAVLSADLFGMTTTNTDDLGIGQILENALPYFDYIMPMVYPSHYPATWNGIKNPAASPYQVIKLSMEGGIRRTEAMGFSKQKMRPWLQDFNLGADYTAQMVRDQIQATYDLGLTSWILWDPANTYTRGALKE